MARISHRSGTTLRFDRVASTCLLTQILETAAHSLGKGHHQLADVEAALRAGHLRLMARLAAPGGEGVLVTEVVSSRILSKLPDLTAKELADMLPGLRRRVTISAPSIPRSYWRPCELTRPSGRSSRPWPSSGLGDGDYTRRLTLSERWPFDLLAGEVFDAYAELPGGFALSGMGSGFREIGTRRTTELS